MQPKDKSFIWDMLNAACEISDFLYELTESQFTADKKTRYAVERQLIVIGEAANHVSVETQKAFPDIPWKKLTGLRNIIAHEYGEILIERIWNIGKQGIPELLENLRKIDLTQR